MASTLTVKLPKKLKRLAPDCAEVGAVSMTEALYETHADAVTGKRLPRNTGALLQSLQVSRVVVADGRVSGSIFVAGVAVQYAGVQEFGRRAGARGPSWRVLFYGPGARGQADGWRSGWVNRRLRARVVDIAASLQNEALQGRRVLSGGFRLASRVPSIDTFERQAAFLLARAIARKIHARGMKGKRFVAVPARKFRRRFRENFARIATATGVTGRDAPAGGTP